MKAYFIFKDGELVGSPIGYTTCAGAQEYLRVSVEYQDLVRKYYRGTIIKPDHPEFEKLVDLGVYKYNKCLQSYCWSKAVWSKKFWQPYFQEHFKIEEKEFEIVFKNSE